MSATLLSRLSTRVLIASLSAACFFSTPAVHADEKPQEASEVIRANLGSHIPQLRNIEEVSSTPMEGLFEVRVGTDIFYTNATGDFIIQGELFDIKAMRNLTEDRIQKLTAVDFSSLPLEDAFTIVRGDGSRQIAIFEDPNCGYCKRFERDMLNVDNVTVHVFLYPILSPDSFEKSRDIWCSKDKTEAWNNWMLNDTKPESVAACEDLDPLQRNLAFGRKYKITGTPTIIFADSSRTAGAIPSAQVEQRLQQATAAATTAGSTSSK